MRRSDAKPRILKFLEKEPATAAVITEKVGLTDTWVFRNLQDLVKEGKVIKKTAPLGFGKTEGTWPLYELPKEGGDKELSQQ